MQSVIYIVGVDKSFLEYSEKIRQLISERSITVMSCGFEEYQNAKSLSDILFDKAKFIFVGTKLLGQPAIPSITSWKYERFGCRIGWEGSKCVIFARDTDLPYSDYKEFRDYCRDVHLNYADVTIPPESPVAEGFEAVKEIFADKKRKSAHRAQYSTLIYEFMDNYFDDFISCESNCGNGTDDSKVPPDITNILRHIKAIILSNLTWKQAAWCNVIIHTAAMSCAAVAFLPIPVADAIPITSAQIAMVVGLGKVFDNKLTKSDAQILLNIVAVPLVGRALAKNIFIFVPGIGWAINGAIAGIITEILGWSIAGHFAAKSKK